MKVLISNEAHKDIEAIFEYISFDSLKYANKTLEKIYLAISKLEKNPNIGRYVPELYNKKYREVLYKSYRIVYSISEEIVYIHFVIHSKRNFKSFYNSYIKNRN